MEIRKRPAAASQDEELQMNICKQAKTEHNETDHIAPAFENASIPMQPDTFSDITMPDANAMIKQDSEIAVNAADRMALPEPLLLLLSTASFEDTLEHLRELWEETTNNDHGNKSNANELKPISELHNSPVATVPGRIIPHDQTVARPDAPGIRHPDLHSYELQEANNRIAELESAAEKMNVRIQTLRGNGKMP